MIQPSPTPVPDHGTGWGLLLLFSSLYGIVALLWVLTIIAIALRYVTERVPQPLQYLAVVTLLGALGVSLFTLLVAATAQLYDVVGGVVLLVFVPLAYVVDSRRGTDVSRLAVITHAALVWSIPFLVGVGMIAVVATLASTIPPAVTGLAAVAIVLAGTILLDRRLGFPVVR